MGFCDRGEWYERRVGEGYTDRTRQVLETLRARIADGTYPSQSVLPPQRDLAAEFGVSRDTVQRVLRELHGEGWIEVRQGRGARVTGTPLRVPTRERSGSSITLGCFLGQAFEESEVTLDVCTLTGESLCTHIRLQAERIWAGMIAPQRIALRLLLPADSVDLPYPRALGGVHDQALRDRFTAIKRHHTDALRQVLRELQTQGLVPAVEAEVRQIMMMPVFDLYLVNRAQALHGFHQVVERRIALGGEDGEDVEVVDVLGPGTRLIHHVKEADPDSPGAAFVGGAQGWFDSVWEHLGSC
ncbi:GntR family transcriptional regulator [Streptomyces griseorubiginosus]|nr:GntR family transcriptional regulator [Streptomyces griseorubiginosus]